MNSYDITFNTWNKVAALYQEKFMDLDAYNDTYDLFCELVKKPNPGVFEIGCGPGNITRYLVNRRPDFQIDAIDVAPNMIQLAKQNIPTASFQVLDVRNLSSVQKSYDAIIAGFCVPYLSKEDLDLLIHECTRLLEGGGIVYLSTIHGNYDQSGFLTGSTGDRCYVYYYDESYLEQLLLKNDFRVVKRFHKKWPLPDGSERDELIIIAERI